MFDTVLVPTDGSVHATRAAEHAGAVARAFDASVHVLSVVDLQVAAGAFSAGGLREEVLDRLEADAAERVEAVLEDVDLPGDVRTDVRSGIPVEVILEYVDEEGVGLVAMGTHGRSGVERFVTGSVAETVVRHAPVPVLTVRRTERSRLDGGYDDVLVPTDGSEHASAAVEPAIELARAFDARVHALTVVDARAVSIAGDYAAPGELVEHLASRGEEAVERIAERARAVGLSASTDVREDHPAAAILDYAEAHDVDLVAMGTAGRTGLDRFLLGSTTARVLRRSEVPVLSVSPGDRSEE